MAQLGNELSADAIADRVNCYGLGHWLDGLADHGGSPLQVPLGQGGSRVNVAFARMGLTVTLFRHADEELSEADQVVFHRVTFDPARAALPFGIDAASLTPDLALRILSDDTAGGRTADFKRGDLRISHFLPDDARVVELTFQPTLVGVSRVVVIRLGGEIAYATLDRRFGLARLGTRIKT